MSGNYGTKQSFRSLLYIRQFSSYLIKHGTSGGVVIYQAYGLQIGIEQCGAEKFESALLKIGGKDIGEFVSCNSFTVEMLLVN